MTYRGHVKNGQIALDEPVSLPEGTSVKVEVIDESNEDLSSLFLRHSGAGRNLPTDLSEHHDHYIHGKPKP